MYITPLAGAIRESIAKKGEECFQNPQVLHDMLEELIPELERARKMVRRVLNKESLKMLEEAYKNKAELSAREWADFKWLMCEEYGMSEEWVKIVFFSFKVALGKDAINWKPKETQPEEPVTNDKEIGEKNTDSKPEQKKVKVPKTVVMGIGGHGNTLVNRMVCEENSGFHFIGVNADRQALQLCKAPELLLIGEKLTKGLGAGARPEIGEKAALENENEITEAIRGNDVLFLACGLGGGCGTGATPVIAQIAKKMGIFTVAAVTMPFKFEGKNRLENAESGLKNLREIADVVVSFSNNEFLGLIDRKMTMLDILEAGDKVLCQSIMGIRNWVKLEMKKKDWMQELQKITQECRNVHVGTGVARGEKGKEEAFKRAVEKIQKIKKDKEISMMIISHRGSYSYEEVRDTVHYIQRNIANVFVVSNVEEAEDDKNQTTLLLFEKEKPYSPYYIKRKIEANELEMPDFLKKAMEKAEVSDRVNQG